MLETHVFIDEAGNPCLNRGQPKPFTMGAVVLSNTQIAASIIKEARKIYNTSLKNSSKKSLDADFRFHVRKNTCNQQIALAKALGADSSEPKKIKPVGLTAVTAFTDSVSLYREKQGTYLSGCAAIIRQSVYQARFTMGLRKTTERYLCIHFDSYWELNKKNRDLYKKLDSKCRKYTKPYAKTFFVVHKKHHPGFELADFAASHIRRVIRKNDRYSNASREALSYVKNIFYWNKYSLITPRDYYLIPDSLEELLSEVV
ncbi:MAG: DUF3800 domain-containing protein [Candidatus Thermoplasmatota archaeon]|nr:DUF3800 domain-containing protein [Candidatus Thermoplasmatota archaeon]